MKKDPLTQSSIKNFCIKLEKPSSQENSSDNENSLVIDEDDKNENQKNDSQDLSNSKPKIEKTKRIHDLFGDSSDEDIQPCKKQKMNITSDNSIEVSKKVLNKNEITKCVVNQMTPYYKKNWISSRDLFKYSARTIVHFLMNKNYTG